MILPHFPWDIVAFFVAKKFNIKILIIKRTLISDRIVFSNDFRVGYSNLIKNTFNLKDKKRFLMVELVLIGMNTLRI